MRERDVRFFIVEIAVPINVNINLDVMPNCLLSRQSSQLTQDPSILPSFLVRSQSSLLQLFLFQRKSKMRAVFDGQPVIKYDGVGRTEVCH